MKSASITIDIMKIGRPSASSGSNAKKNGIDKQFQIAENMTTKSHLTRNVEDNLNILYYFSVLSIYRFMNLVFECSMDMKLI